MGRRILATLLASTILASASGCATIFAPAADLVPVSTKPAGAAVFLDGMPMGRTPTVVPVPRSSEGVFTFELPGYETAKVDRDKVVNGITFLNLDWAIFWPMIPVAFLVDIISGDIGKYSTAPIRIELQPKKPADDVKP